MGLGRRTNLVAEKKQSSTCIRSCSLVMGMNEVLNDQKMPGQASRAKDAEE